MTLALFPLLATIHFDVLKTIVPFIVVGATAVYGLLPRPKPLPWWMGTLVAAFAVLIAIPTVLSTRIITLETFLFYAFALSAVVSGGLLVTQHNPARAALSFAVVILSTCGLFLLLAAPFLAAATIIIYAGAIIVTFLFVLMLAQQAGLGDADARSREPLLATLTGFILLGALVYVLQLNYMKDDGISQALDEVLIRTRAARNNTADLKPGAYSELSATLTEPLIKLLPPGGNPSAPRLARLDDIRAAIENSLTNAKNTDDVKTALDQIERRVLYTQQQQGSIQPALKGQVMSNFSGPSANEPVDNLRYDDQGRPAMPADNSAYLGRSLFTDYLLPVELGGFLLLVAVIGSVAIAQRRAPSAPAETLP